MNIIAVAWQIHADEAIVIGGVCAAVGAIVRWPIRPMVRFFKRMEASIVLVEHELKPNNGSSVKDAITRIDHRVAALETRVQAESRTVDLISRVTPTLPKDR